MLGFLAHVGAKVLCSHGGQVQPSAPNPRVTVSGQPGVTMAAPWLVAACALPPSPAANGPNVTAQFVTGATRVTSNGQPLLVSRAICAPTGTPLLIVADQTRVAAM